jgi:hypothetical protein
VRDLECPFCNADVPMDGDEKPGESVSCSFCRAPLRVVRKVDEDDLELEDDL